MLKSIGLLLAAALALGPAALRPAAAAEKAEAKVEATVKVVGYVVKIDMSQDGKSAVATLLVKGKKIDILVQDELTLKKFRIKKIQKDDEIRCKYKVVDDKNVSVSFLRTAGC